MKTGEDRQLIAVETNPAPRKVLAQMRLASD
jgi:hypothetical protein